MSKQTRNNNTRMNKYGTVKWYVALNITLAIDAQVPIKRQDENI